MDIRIGEQAFTLRPLTEDEYDRAFDARRSEGLPASDRITIYSGVTSPPAEAIDALFKRRPALKRLLASEVARLSGQDDEVRALDTTIDSPEALAAAGQPDAVGCVIGGQPYVLRPPTEDEYDAMTMHAGNSPSAALGNLVRTCLLYPAGEAADPVIEARPGHKAHLYNMVQEAAGAGLEVVRGK